MLIWKRLMPSNVRTLLAFGTLTALVAVATLKPLPHVWGQDKEAPSRKVEQKGEEKAEERIEKKQDEPAPLKEGEVKQEGRDEKTEKEPTKEEGDAPRKVEGKAPIKEEGRGPRKTEGKEPMKEEGDVPRKVEGKGPEGRPVPRKGDPENPKDPVPGRGRPGPEKEMKEPGEGKRPVPGKDDPKGGPIVGFNGGISFDAKHTSKCGKGQICYNYALPTMKTPAGMITGTLVITLNIYQHGNPTPLVFTPPTLMQSGVLKDGDHYCFDVNPTTFPGIDLNAGGFDFVASAKFSLGGNDTTVLVGSVPQGVVLLTNNDYRIECETSTGTDGKIVYDARTSTNCGKGQICFNVKLPTMKDEKGNIITATGLIKLNFYQDGQPAPFLTLTSTVLTSETGARYCFQIDPASIPNPNNRDYFDFAAIATFSFSTLGTPDITMSVGMMPEGIIPDRNNDYRYKCVEPPHEETDRCCLGKNLVKNGDFEQPGVNFHSEYQQAGSLDQLYPGTFNVTNVGSIGKACESWHLPKACDGTGFFSGNVLVVNGQNNLLNLLPPTTIWEQTILLPSLPGVEKQEYRICFRYLPLPQCCFNVPAKPVLQVSGPNGPMAVFTNDDDVGCGHLYSATISATPGTQIQLHIKLSGGGKGDGNDLLIDNISLVPLEKMPFALVDFTLFADPVNGDGTKDVTLTAPGGLMAPYTWWWSMYDPTTGITTNYPGTSTLSFPGLESTTEDYVFKLQAKGPCNSLGGSKQDWSFGTRARAGKTVEDPNPEPVDLKTVKEGNPEAVKNRKESPALKKRSE